MIFSVAPALSSAAITLGCSLMRPITTPPGCIAGAVEGTTGTAPDDVLDNAATHILHHLLFEVRRPPSRK
jgi:hypothetical protein